MPVEGQWTVNGSAEELRLLSTRLRVTGQSGLKKNMAKAIRTATLPARQAVKRELLDVMPKEGGLNEFLASSSIRSAVLTGPKTAGVVIRGSKRGHDLKTINRTGRVRHPVFRSSRYPNPPWATTDVPSGWWEHVLEPFGAGVHEALVIAQNLTAKEAGFI